MLPPPAAAWLDEPKPAKEPEKKKKKLKEPKPDHRRFCRTCGRERWLHPHGKFGPSLVYRDLDSKLQG